MSTSMFESVALCFVLYSVGLFLVALASGFMVELVVGRPVRVRDSCYMGSVASAVAAVVLAALLGSLIPLVSGAIVTILFLKMGEV